MEVYIGLCILCRVLSNKECVRELWIRIFGNSMARNRFENIRIMLRFDNSAIARLRNDRMASTPLLLDCFFINSHKCYLHNERVTVDEELLPFGADILTFSTCLTNLLSII